MKLLLFAIVFFAFCSAAAQAVVANEKMNIAYVSVDNPLSVAVSGYPCSSVVLTTNNGEMKKVSCGSFIYRPEKLGAFSINICVKKGNKLKVVSKWIYIIKRLPEPVALIGPYSGDNIDKMLLMKMGGVVVRLLDLDINAPFQIQGYTASAIRNDSNLFFVNNTGAQYNNNVVGKLETLKGGDHLLICNIKCIGPDGQLRIIAPLEFTITE